MKKFYMVGSAQARGNSGYFALTVYGEELTEEFIKDCRKKLIEESNLDNATILNIIELKG